MKSLYALIQKNADRLFAALGLIGAALIAKSGNYADNNGDAHNIYLSASGLIELAANVFLLLTGDKGRPICAPGFVLGGLALFASGVGLFSFANGSTGEILSGTLWTCGAIMIFYGDRLFPRMKFSGGLVGSWFYQLCIIPLFYSGIQHDNPYEWSAATAWALSNLVMATKPKLHTPSSISNTNGQK